MPIVRPQDVISEIGGEFYRCPNSPQVFDLGEGAIASPKKILKLVQRIPEELMPKGHNRQLFSSAIYHIRHQLQKAEAEPASHHVLQGVAAYNFENPLSMLGRMLLLCPNFRPNEIRRRLLEAAAANEQRGDPGYFADTSAQAWLRNVPVEDIRRHMRILQHEGLVIMDQTLAGQCAIGLTPAGWKAL